MKNIAAFCFLEHEDKILLVKKNYGNKSWTLPGGAIEPQEGFELALIREVMEETGQRISGIEFVASFYSRDHYSIALCFKAQLNQLVKIAFNPEEISNVEFFDFKELPKPMSPRYQFWIESYQRMKQLSPKNLFQYD